MIFWLSALPLLNTHSRVDPAVAMIANSLGWGFLAIGFLCIAFASYAGSDIRLGRVTTVQRLTQLDRKHAGALKIHLD